MKRILSGIQPTGGMTLGNYLGAIKNWVSLQNEGESECLYCIVDLHAITIPYDIPKLKDHVYEMAATFIACGLNHKKSALFIQSHVQAHAQLNWLLTTQTPIGWLNRMTQFKDKAGKDKEKASLGLYAYPVLQAADILIYHTTHVPVGEDQKQHIELARDIAGAFNRHVGVDFFPLPDPVIQKETARIMSLRDATKKMSKSDPSDYSRINLRDSADEISQKIRKAKTDPHPLPESIEGLEGRPEAANLLGIYAALQNISLEKTVQQFSGYEFSRFKKELEDVVITHLSPITQEIQKLLQDTAFLQKALKEGGDKATQMANPILQKAFELMGFVKF